MNYSESPWRSFSLALVTIELEAAFVVAAQDGDNLFDAVFVTDANGLPCIPGESLAGILRHALAGGADPTYDQRCKQVFGFQAGGDGDASRVRISFAHVHDKEDRPVPFRGAKLKDDPVLAALQAGVGRDHVRIGKHGAVDGRGKFDELLVPAGARFTFEICLSDDSGIQLTDLLAQLARSEVRIGGKTRRGLGAFRVVRAASAKFDLTKKEDVARLGRVRVAIDQAVGSKELKSVELPKAASAEKTRRGTITLRPIGTWMIGGGIPVGQEGKEPDHEDKPWDRVPLRERRITWESGKAGDRGTVASDHQADFLLPASSVKGALRHRTAFHARRLTGEWLEPGQSYNDSAAEETWLFGEVRKGDKGQPGCVTLSDVYLQPSKVPFAPLQHVSLDRFTQGPMDHMLYDELALGDTELRLEIVVSERGQDDHSKAFESLDAALRDLCEGRLSLGAGRGHGRFLGKVDWVDNVGLVAKETAKC